MATSDFLGLFVSPEQYQAQQLAQQQAAEQQRAFNFAQLSPRDQAVYGTFLGAQQLGRGFSGLLGVQDPQLQRIRQREQIMQSINPADPESLMAGIQRASQSNDPELALTLANYMRDAASNVALAKQRETEKVPQDIQIAARIRQLTADRLKLPENERGPIDAEIKRLEKLGRQGSTDKVEQLRDLYVAEEDAVRKAQAKAAPSQTVGLDGLPMATPAPVNVDNDPEVRAIRSLIRVATGDKEGKEIEVVAKATALADTVSSDRNSAAWKEKYKTELTRLTADKDTEKTTDAIVNATALADATGKPKTSVEWKNEFNNQLKRLTTKEIADKYSPEAQKLIDAGYIPGSPSFISKMDEVIAKDLRESEGKDQITSIGETVAGNKEGLPAGLKVYTNKTSKTQYVLRDGKEVPYYGSVEPPGKTTVEVKNIMPGQGKDGPKGISAFRNEVIQSIKPFRDTVTGADSALASIKDSMKNKNYISFNAARTQLAKALGDNTLSRNDIEQAGADPSILGGLYDKASTLFTGTPSPDTQKKIESTIKIIRKLAVEKANAELGVQRQLGIRAGYTEQDINMAFNFPEITGGDGAAKPENKKTVPFNALPKK